MSEITKAVDFLLDAAHFFRGAQLDPNGVPKNIRVAIQCLYTALSLVLPPSREVEIQVLLGEWLLEFSEQQKIGVEHLQKAYRLLQKTSIDAGLRRRAEASLVYGLLKTNMSSMDGPIIEDALKRAEDVGDWDYWIQFFIFDLKSCGPSSLRKIDRVKPRFNEEQKEFIDIFSALTASSDINHEECLANLQAFEDSIPLSKFALLKSACCLVMRLKLCYSEGFKTLLVLCKKALNDCKDTGRLPGNMILKLSSLKEIFQNLLLLAQLKFQLPDVSIPENLSCQKSSVEGLFELELTCLRGHILSSEVSKALSSLQKVLYDTNSYSGNASSVEPFINAQLPSSLEMRFRLWKIQLLLQNDIYQARDELQNLKKDQKFSASPYYYLLEALSELKSRDSVHRVKESLLNALKLLNAPGGRDDLLKLCVMLLLASLYKETDFNLAEKMASTAYVYSCNLGNDRMAYESGKILARMLELKGDYDTASRQALLNSEIETRLSLN